MEINKKKLIEVQNKDISFHVHDGECLGLLGGSGVGKSVLL